MKLTKLKCLELCRDLWIEMRDKKYHHWVEKEKTEVIQKQNFYSDCPCCQYILNKRKTINGYLCRNYCLLRKLWGKAVGTPCVGFDSPYRSFNNGYGTPADADKIVQFCIKEIKKLKLKARK